MRMKLVGVMVGLLVGATSGIAHHSWPVEYDANKPISVKGVVSKVEWTNPHTHFYVDVIDENGKLTTWNFEMASTVALERGGWTRKTLPVGATITVTGFGGRAVITKAIANSMVTVDGKSLFVAPKN
jgi:uncharacterized protein DUF6152